MGVVFHPLGVVDTCSVKFYPAQTTIWNNRGIKVRCSFPIVEKIVNVLKKKIGVIGTEPRGWQTQPR